jgi:hypothetical protein
MEESTKFHIANLQLEGIAQTWWDKQLERYELIVDLGTPPSPTNGIIDSWYALCHALWEHFYLPYYLQNILAKWLQLHQISTQSVQGYIDIFCKLHIQLHLNEPDEVSIINFNL